MYFKTVSLHSTTLLNIIIITLESRLKQTSSSDNLPMSDDDKHCSRCFNSVISWRNIALSILSHNALQMGARLYSRAGVIRGRYVHRLLVMTERADSSLAYRCS